MGDGQHGAAELEDVLLQPLHAPEVQVVGGLVQQEDVGLLQQQAGQVHPGLFAAGEAVEFLGAHPGGDAQTAADLVGLHVHVVTASHGEGGAEPVVLRQGASVGLFAHGVLQGGHLPLHVQQGGEGRAQHLLHRVARGVAGDLGDEAQLLARGDHDRALVGTQLAREDAEQGGLAAAVAAHDAHALAGVDVEAQAVQQIISDFKGFYQVFYGYINHVCLRGWNIAPETPPAHRARSAPAAGRWRSCAPGGPASAGGACAPRGCRRRRTGRSDRGLPW